MFGRLARYSPRKRDLETQYPNLWDGGYVFKFGVDGMPDGVPGIFLSTMDSLEGADAKSFLALGFDPYFRYVWLFPGDFDETVAFRNPYGGRVPSRVWPAYGQDGGGWEILLIKGALRYGIGVQLLSSPPPYDQDMDGNRSGPLLAPFLLAMQDWFRDLKSSDPSKEDPVWKIEPSRVVMSWMAGSGNRYALSCVLERPTPAGRTRVHFWDYGWRDYEERRCREIWGPLEISDTFSCSKEELDQKERDKVFAVLNCLHSRLVALVNSNRPKEVKLL